MALLDKNILNEQNKKDLEKVKGILAENQLNWTWESIQYTLFNEEIDWESLRTYDGKFKNIITIIMAGLPKEKRDKETAFEILETFANNGIHPVRLHKFLVEVLQERHFFMDTEEERKLQNLIEADLTDQVTLQNLIYVLISKESERQSYLSKINSSINQENSSTNQ